MIAIIYAEHTNRILRYIKKSKVLYPFIWVGNHIDTDKEILSASGMKEIELYEPNDREKISNEREYISTISMLGSMYSPMEWWANGVSEKNEHLSSHYKNMVLYCCLIKTIKMQDIADGPIFVISNSEIFNQLKEYCAENGIDILSLEESVSRYIEKIFSRGRFCLNVLMMYVRVVFKKRYVDSILGAGIKKEIHNKQVYYTIKTRIDGRFLAKDYYSQDILFGDLPSYVGQHGYKVLIIARIPDGCYSEIVRKIKDIKNMLIVPDDYFLSYSDLFRLWKYLHFKKSRLTKKIVFSELKLDVSKIYEEEVNNGFFSIDYLRNILTYFIAKSFARTVNFKIYVQTFENYAWEKLNIMGIKEDKSHCKIFGFQHAFISRNSFKYFLGDMNRVPLPDKIITMGSNTRDILEKYGSYNKDILVTGCALRQEYIANVEPVKRRQVRRILVPLTMARDESVLILKFLYDSGLSGTHSIIAIRTHPALTFEKFEKDIHFRIPDNFIINNEKTVKEELFESDMVLYTWSTVAVEALKLGLPVVYLDILKPMYVDPLFECNALKRTASKKEELRPAIESIYAMSDEEFYREQGDAQRYLKGYFYPVNADTLAPFFGVSDD